MDIAQCLRDRFPRLALSEKFQFARHTTIGCGGVAACAAMPAHAEEAAQVLSFLIEARISFCFLGAGANVLPAEGYFDGVVVRFCRMDALYACGDAVYAGAGVTGGRLLAFSSAQGIGGFEAFSGIPMSVGGGVAMNAGVRELHFSDVTERVLAAENGRLVTLSRSDCMFAEKESVFGRGIAVLGAYLKGRRSDPHTIASAACFFRRRRAGLPKGRSMGCAFVNPPEGAAGAIIERCGLKGAQVGGARVSELHANFILNEGGTADDVSALAELIAARVHMQTGIALREEFRRIP